MNIDIFADPVDVAGERQLVQLGEGHAGQALALKCPWIYSQEYLENRRGSAVRGGWVRCWRELGYLGGKYVEEGGPQDERRAKRLAGLDAAVARL